MIDSLYLNYGQFDERFSQALTLNKHMVGEAQGWMDKTKHQLDDYTQKTDDNPHFIAFDMLGGC